MIEKNRKNIRLSKITAKASAVVLLLSMVFSILAAPIHAAEEEYVMGDIDGSGRVTLLDAKLALRAALAIDELKGRALVVARVNGGDDVGMDDVLMILKDALNIPVEFAEPQPIPSPTIIAVRTDKTADLVITLTGGTFDPSESADEANWTVDIDGEGNGLADSGLTGFSVAYDNATQVTVTFAGEAAVDCEISITPDAAVLATGDGEVTGATVSWLAPVYTVGYLLGASPKLDFYILKDGKRDTKAPLLWLYIFSDEYGCWVPNEVGAGGVCNTDTSSNAYGTDVKYVLSYKYTVIGGLESGEDAENEDTLLATTDAKAGIYAGYLEQLTAIPSN